MPQTPTVDIRGILDPLPVPKEVKAAAWDAFQSSRNDAEFRIKFASIGLPKEAKADLWDAKAFTPEQTLQQKPATPAKGVDTFAGTVLPEALGTMRSALMAPIEHPVETAKTVLGVNDPMNLALPKALIGDVASGNPELAAGKALGVAGAAGLTALVGKGVPAVKNRLPSTARGGAKFNAVMAKAKDVPIDTQEISKIVLRARELEQAGAVMPKVMGKAEKALANGPLTYEKGRDFASNAGRLSASERLRTNPQMKRQVSQLAAALKEENRKAASSVGMGDVYDSAMREYRLAMKMSDAIDTMKGVTKDKVFRAALGATIAGEIARRYFAK